jgi:hypothetical protein
MSCIMFAITIPPFYDEEIALGSPPEAKLVEGSHNFIVYGLSQGGIIFCPIQNPDKIYTRVSVHRDAVKHIAEIEREKSFVSVSEFNEMKIWKFGDSSSSQVLKTVCQVNILRELSQLTCFGENVVMMFKEGDL